ncbi:ABC transporter permease [bacterium]|nr:ABC transporter permease [bacterium]QQR57942.1 MAG: ABC transporter permease [Candidatus Melainabacteria bacterium]
MLLRVILKRMLAMIPLLLVIATLTFMVIRVVPGGPFDQERNLPPQILANLNAKYHLDKPVLEQYWLYLGRLCHGDLGVSYKYVDRTVVDIIKDAFPVSIQLGGAGLLIAILVGVPLGTIAALRRGTHIDHLAMFVSTMGLSLPLFVVGALLILIFAIWGRILPAALWESPFHAILPAVTIAFKPMAYIARLTRASVLEILQKDWVRIARSKGLSESATIIKHVLRNALIPVVTLLGPVSAVMIAGSFVVEIIYAIPGMGRFFVTAVMNRDYDLIMGITLIFSVVLVITNTIVDVLYMILDPRISYE